MSTAPDHFVRDRRFGWDFALSVAVGVLVTLPWVGDSLDVVAASVILASALMMRRCCRPSLSPWRWWERWGSW